tara:strand:- start:263084 stop:263611 length:528 start_codon:yes stop_codon:yes gene_type:complete
MRTLVLDQSYSPHRVVSWQRAVTMLFQGKVEILEEYDEDIRSISITIKMPAVVRLLRKVARRRSVKFSRINVATRDKYRCQYCGTKHTLKRLTYDHVIPRAQGGKTTWENIVMACQKCNSTKGNQTPAQANMRLLSKPVKPNSLPVVRFHIDPQSTLPEQWANWCYWHGTLDEGS